MKKLISALLALVLGLSLTTAALADHAYIFPDSSARRLTWQEVDAWDYESLGFAFHEILARHGFVFNPNGNYYAYFNSQPWYVPNADANNDRACYPRLSGLEWDNIELIKAVRARKEHNDYGRSLWDVRPGSPCVLPDGFTLLPLQAGQVLPVYAAPGVNSYRAVSGLAEVSTNGPIYAAGMENGWLLILYGTNNGAARVGYIDARQLSGYVPYCGYLHFSRFPAALATACSILDDPITRSSTIATLPAGASVTYLTTFYGNGAWDYVEFSAYGQLARGFIPAGLLYIADDGPTLLD